MPLLARSFSRKILATLVAVVAFVLLYEATMRDSRSAREAAMHDPTVPMAGSRLQFNATAYCKGRTTASGVNVRTGIAAADPDLLPVGSVITVSTVESKYNGVYTIMDTGPKVQGRLLDLYMWSCHEALAFGRKEAQVRVLRLGWNPSASTPSLINTLFRRRERGMTEPRKPTVAVPLEAAPATTDEPLLAPPPEVTPTPSEALAAPAPGAAPE